MGEQVSLAQRVAGEEGFKGKTGVNALVAFLHSDQRALSTMVASAGVAKVPVPWRGAVGGEEGAVRRHARAARHEGAGRHAPQLLMYGPKKLWKGLAGTRPALADGAPASRAAASLGVKKGQQYVSLM